MLVSALLALAALAAYAAAAVLVRTTPLVLPGTRLPLPAAVVRVVPGLNATAPDGGPASVPMTVLVLGLDRRPHHDPAVDGPPNTDAMHLVRLDPRTHTASVLAIPRDLYVELPSPVGDGTFWEARINAAYALGEQYHYPGGGLAFTRRVVEATFHIPLTATVVLDWVAFADMIDALGGIDLTVTAPVHQAEAFNPRDFSTRVIDIPSGSRHLDAVTALAYARFRDDDANDFGRMRRQQEVMQAAARRARDGGWLGQGVALYQRFARAVQTDLPVVRVPGVLALAGAIDLDQIRTGTMAGEDTAAVQRVITPWGEDVLVPIWERMAPIIRAAVPDAAVQAEAASVAVVNATGIPGQGARAASYLTRFALTPEQVTAVDAADGGGVSAGVHATTTLTVTGSVATTAQRIAAWLGLPDTRIRTVDSVEGASNHGAIVLTLGTDVRLPDDDRFHRYPPR